MNFKGNSFSLGSGEVISSYFLDGSIRVFIKRNSVIGLREFNQQEKTMRVIDSNISYSDACWHINNGIIELNGGELTFENR